MRVVGVDPVGSVYAYYHEHGRLPPAEELHLYLIDGIGQSYIPPSCWSDYIDEIIDGRRPDRLPRSVFELARKRGDLHRLLGRRRRLRRARGGAPPAGRRVRGHALPRFGRALPVQAERRVAAREGPARARRELRRGLTPTRRTRRPLVVPRHAPPAARSAERLLRVPDPGACAGPAGRSRSGARAAPAPWRSSSPAATRTPTSRPSPRATACWSARVTAGDTGMRTAPASTCRTGPLRRYPVEESEGTLWISSQDNS